MATQKLILMPHSDYQLTSCSYIELIQNGQRDPSAAICQKCDKYVEATKMKYCNPILLELDLFCMKQESQWGGKVKKICPNLINRWRSSSGFHRRLKTSHKDMIF